MTIQYTVKRISEVQRDISKIRSALEAWGYQAEYQERKSERAEYVRQALLDIYEVQKTLTFARNVSARGRK